MDQITVPQFLDVEDRIIGSITVRQFVEMLIAGLLIFIFYRIFDFPLFIISGLATITLLILVAFVKIKGQSFHYFLLNFISTMKNPKLKVWRKVVSKSDIIKGPKEEEKVILPPQVLKPPVTSSRLSELSLIIDTGGVYRGEDNI